MIRKIITLMLLLSAVPFAAGAEESCGGQTAKGQEDVNVREIVFGHIQDSYQWHITKWKDKDITIPLPVILYSSESGFSCFLSDKIYPAGTEYNGFRIATEGKHEGKIVETCKDGSEIRPIDISLTKTACGIVISSIILLAVMLSVAHWYKNKKADSPAPKGFVGLMEMFIMYIYENVIEPCVGQSSAKYAPYLLTAFFFIFINNLLGLVPIFPGGANVTGNITVTATLAVITFIAVNVSKSKEYWKDIFWPDVPAWLKVPIPLMPAVEIFGMFTKPLALAIRLFANCLAGHCIILSLICTIFLTLKMGPAINSGMTVVSVIFATFMNLLEILVAFIQAFVFTLLSAVFIGQSHPEKHLEKENATVENINQ